MLGHFEDYPKAQRGVSHPLDLCEPWEKVRRSVSLGYPARVTKGGEKKQVSGKQVWRVQITFEISQMVKLWMKSDAQKIMILSQCLETTENVG